jgi:hypothetical protein
MKKAQIQIIVYLALTLISTICFAQEKFRASISMGQVYPLGRFSSIDQTSKQSGYARTGFTLNIDGDYHIHNRLAVSLRFLFGNSQINQTEFRKFLNNELSGYISSTDTIQYNINYWQWASPMVGLKYNYPIIINKFYLEVGAFTGVNFVQIPDQNLYFNDYINKRAIVSQNVGFSDITLPLAVNAGLRFRINPQMQLKLNAEYFYTKTSIDHVSYYQLTNSIEQVEIEKYQFDVPIQSLNISLGLVYNFQ